MTMAFSRDLWLLIDIHGQSHEEQRIELGYLLSSSELKMDNSTINSSSFKNESSVRSLLNKNLIVYLIKQ